MIVRNVFVMFESPAQRYATWFTHPPEENIRAGSQQHRADDSHILRDLIGFALRHCLNGNMGGQVNIESSQICPCQADAMTTERPMRGRQHASFTRSLLPTLVILLTSCLRDELSFSR